MTSVETHEVTVQNERPVLRRTFGAEFTAGTGRTVDVRVVPYDTPADVSDGGPVYREEWAQGCFDDQLVAGHRLKVLLNFEHERGIANIVGKGVELRSRTDGLHGSFEVLETQDGDKALALVKAGILDGVSLEAYAKKTVRTADGVMRRVKAHLHNVALCRTPAFTDARVLAVREEVVEEIILDSDLLPVELDPGNVERWRRLGLKLPARIEAHPASGHPGETGTSEDGTRPKTTEHRSSEVHTNEHDTDGASPLVSHR